MTKRKAKKRRIRKETVKMEE